MNKNNSMFSVPSIKNTSDEYLNKLKILTNMKNFYWKNQTIN